MKLDDFKKSMRSQCRVLGRTGVKYAILTVALGLVLTGVEFAFAIAMQAFLSSLDLLQTSSLKSFSFINLSKVTFFEAVMAVFLVGALRTLCFSLVSYLAAAVRTLFHFRLKHLSYFAMLKHKSVRAIGLAEHHSMHGVYDKAAEHTFYSIQIIANATQTIGIALVLLTFAPRETLIGMLSLGVVGFYVLQMGKKINALGKQRLKEQFSLSQTTVKITKNWIYILALRRHHEEHSHLTASSRREFVLLLQARALSVVTASTPQFAGITMACLVVALSHRLFGTSGGVLVSFLYLFLRFTMSFSSTATCLGELRVNQASYERAIEFASEFGDEELEAATAPIEQGVPIASFLLKAMNRGKAIEGKSASGALRAQEYLRLPRSAPSIEYEGLYFAHQEQGPPTIADFSFKIEAGEQLGIIGKSGSGKSTLLALTLGILNPARGKIRINNVSAAQYFNDPTSRFGFVSSEPFLFSGSVRENLLYGNSFEVSDQALWQILGQVDLGEAFKAKNTGLDTPLDELASQLSAGQKQRLGLARALLLKPSILILDEVSSNLDEETEAIIAREVNSLRGHCTVLNVSHRRGMLNYSDRILDLGLREIRYPFKAVPADPQSEVDVIEKKESSS